MDILPCCILYWPWSWVIYCVPICITVTHASMVPRALGVWRGGAETSANDHILTIYDILNTCASLKILNLKQNCDWRKVNIKQTAESHCNEEESNKHCSVLSIGLINIKRTSTLWVTNQTWANSKCCYR